MCVLFTHSQHYPGEAFPGGVLRGVSVSCHQRLREEDFHEGVPSKGRLEEDLRGKSLSGEVLPDEQTRGLVSKETVVLRRWRRETQNLDLSTELTR